MRYIAIITVVLAASLAVSAVLIDKSRLLVNHPPPGLASRGKAPEYIRRIRSLTKTKPVPAPVMLRKGEYMCGDTVCKLRAEQPPPCDSCQYPV